MYYPAISEENENVLTFYCRCCGNKENQTDEICVLSTNTTNVDEVIHYTINEYTKYDPTLPRMYNMMCPNPLCTEKKKTEIYIQEPSPTNSKTKLSFKTLWEKY
jgi:hypothetical protein